MVKSRALVTNEEIAGILDEIAGLLEFQKVNPFRVRAFRTGASQIRSLDEPVEKLVAAKGVESLDSITGIGEGLSSIITEYLQTGRSSFLERLRGEVTPVDLISQVGGLGQELAARAVNELNIHSLEELEEAAYDGRLAKVKGFGPQRIKTIQDSLAGVLSRSARRGARERILAPRRETAERPPVELLMELDEEYRRKAAAGQLKKVAPKRFNPEKEAWLPVMHTNRDGWSFTVLFSNTALAHNLGTTRDWVVIYYEKGGLERQATVMTAGSGKLKGKRVVRGREMETRRYYSW